MHISEGVLSTPVIVVSAVITAGLLINSIRKLDENNLSKVALMSALFFVVSTIHLPIGVTSVHFMILGIIGIMLGWHSFTALIVALLLQALLIGFGGITSLVVNTLNTGVGALIAYYMFQFFKGKMADIVLAFLIGFVPTIVASIGIAVALMFSSDEFITVAKTAVAAHLPLAIVEGIIMIFLFRSLQKYRIKELEL